MGKRPSGKCVFCLQTRLLCRSHVISDFAYRPLYDDQGRCYSFEALNPDNRKVIQTGAYSHLLCEECEQERNCRFEQPFQRQWITENALSALDGRRSGTLRGLNYTAFKLFHLSTLLLAHASPHEHFNKIKLGSDHANRIRAMIQTQDAGPYHEFPIMCFVGEASNDPEGRWDQFVDANTAWYSGLLVFHFTFLGCIWGYADTRVLTPDFDRFCLKENGDLPVVKSLEFFKKNLMSRTSVGSGD